MRLALPFFFLPILISTATTKCPPFNYQKSFAFTSLLPHNFSATSLPLPIPTFTPDFRMVISHTPKVSVGLGIWGQRNWIAFTGGSWVAVWGSGSVVSGGQDSQLETVDLSSRIMTTYLLMTNDTKPAYIVVTAQGWRTGSREVLERLNDPKRADMVKPSEYKFLLAVSMESGDSRYAHVNTKMWVGSAAKVGAEIVYDAYVL
ncbi:hypothetical protein K440DRAFT_613332 [Wilcoxina mikolae CBS 423.85]|nr:hypothetical protein K440DRAFT_613332 [Wilcoxina mikolae CBS 423.85]